MLKRRPIVVILLFFSCYLSLSDGRTIFASEEEESVVSVYTTPVPTGSSTKPPDVYRQIANNLVERFTAPIYRFFGYNNTSTHRSRKPKTLSKTDVSRLEIDETSIEGSGTGKPKTVDNSIDGLSREIEETSAEYVTKRLDDSKPERITLYSAYKQDDSENELNSFSVDFFNNANSDISQEEIPHNSTGIMDVDTIEPFDDSTSGKGNERSFGEGILIYFLELVGSAVTIAWGAISGWFSPPSGT